MAANEIVNGWETSSTYWQKHQATIEDMFAPLTRALVAAADIQEGQRVLDIGGGGGEPSLSIAEIVGNSGSVVYTDPAAGMVKAATAEAQRRRLSNITFHQSPAEELDFPDNSFDAVVGRLSAMFFVDAQLALRSILRVTKRGGRIALVVWASRDLNPFFSVISDVLNTFVPSEAEGEDAPTAFRFATSGKLATIFRKAGAVSVTEQRVSLKIESAIEIEQFWQMRTEMSDTCRGKLAQLGSEQISKAKTAAVIALRPHFANGRISFPAEVLIVSGRK